MLSRLLVYGFHAPELVPAVHSAITGIAEVAHWIGVNRDGQRFDDDIIQWHLGKDLFLPKPFQSGSLDKATQKIVSDHFPQIKEQLARNPYCREFNDVDFRELAEALFSKFERLLVAKKIELALFQNLPHEGFEFVLYLAARHLGIPTILCYQSVVENRFFYCDALEDFGWFKSCEELPPEAFQTPRAFRKELFYMRNQLPNALHESTNRRATWLRAKYALKEVVGAIKSRTGYYRLRRKTPARPDPAVEYRRKLQRSISRKVSFDDAFVYFPLHLQPELTTSAIGDGYSDQVLAIEELSSWLPAGVSILVKENPKQDERCRESDFFERLLKNQKVKLVPTETDTYELLEKCMFAATITGTVGWEAISGGKPVVVFGRPWYLTLPGVFYWPHRPEYSSVINERISHVDFCAGVSKLLRKSRIGIVDMNYRQAFERFDPAANARDVSVFLRRQVNLLRCAND